MWLRSFVVVLGSSAIVAAQASPAENQQQGWRPAGDAAQEQAPAEAAGDRAAYTLEPGTRVPLTLINSISTKHSAEGDRVYLETAFPILVRGKIVIPPGSYVAGTITQIKRPGRIKGRGEFFLRFDSLTLANGVTRDFRARIGGLDGRSDEELDRTEGKVKSEGNKAGDARTLGEATAAGASVGALAGSVAGRPGLGAGVGAAAGAAAGLMGILLSRGPEAMLVKGSTVEMVLDRPVSFDEKELDFTYSMQRISIPESGTPATKTRRSLPIPGLGFPY